MAEKQKTIVAKSRNKKYCSPLVVLKYTLETEHVIENFIINGDRQALSAKYLIRQFTQKH
jgi:hypothetical protein